MTRKQIFCLKMYCSVEKYISGTTMFNNPKVQKVLENFKNQIFKIENVNKEIMTANVEIRKKVCQAGAEIELLLATNSKIHNNGYGVEPTLALYYSVLQRKSKEDLVEALQRIHDEANSKIIALANFGITPSVMEYIQSMINDYSQGNSESMFVRVKSKEMKALYLEAELLLKEIDKIAESFGKKNPDFYIAYAANRIPIAPAKMKTRLKGMVLDENEMPIEGAVICIYGTNYETKTDTNGYYVLQNIPFGRLKVTASVYSYSNGSSIVRIEKTKSNKVNFILQSTNEQNIRQRQAG